MQNQSQEIAKFVQEHFYAEYLEGLKEFVRIPSLAPIFDKNWLENRALFTQMEHLVSFAKKVGLEGMQIKDLADEGRSPFLIVDIAAHPGKTGRTPELQVLMYGHLDKQPFGEGWDTDPCDPVIIDDRLYGRGSSDDGYAFFTAMLSIQAC